MADEARLLRYAREMRRAPTVVERRLWTLLRDRRLAGLKFRRQVPLGDYIADFACFHPKLVVEADGSSHAGDDAEAYDAAQDFWMREQGFTVLRFRDGLILAEPETVLAAIRDAADQA